MGEWTVMVVTKGDESRKRQRKGDLQRQVHMGKGSVISKNIMCEMPESSFLYS